MMKRLNWAITCIMLIFIACSETEQQIGVSSVSYIFSESDSGWVGDFADYPENDSITFQLLFKYDTIPSGTSVNSTRYALLISGDNKNDDLFMFTKKKISGLKPNAKYDILFNVKVASNAKTGAVGAPGESVYLKAGATVLEPRKELLNGTYRMNLDKGNQDEDGGDMIILGHVGVGPTTSQYTVITRNNSNNSFVLTTDASGVIWVIVGTDSGFNGITTLYYTQVDVLFNRLD